MYDPIFAKSFSRYDRRRFGCFALLFSFILSLTICSTFKPSLHPLTLIGDAVSLHLSISAVESMLIDEAIIINGSAKEVSDAALRVDETELPRLDPSNVEIPHPRNELVSSGAELPRLDQEKVELSNPQNELTIDKTELPQLDQEKVELQNQENELAIDKAELPRLDQEKVVLPNPQNKLTINKTELPQLDQEKVELPNPENELVINETETNRPQIIQNMQDTEALSPQNKLIINESERNPTQIQQKQNVEPLNPRSELVSNEPERNPPQIQQKLSSEPLCRILKANADYCEIEGDVRVDPNSSTIFLVKPRSTISATDATSSWIIEPYPRKGTGWVKKWTVKIAAADDISVPKCGETHPQPALLFSIGGFSGNHFHDFADLLVPIFTTSFRFKTEVQFLATDYKQWWPGKYRPLLNRLTRHVIVDIDHQNAALCYKNLIAGLQYHGELVMDPAAGVLMHQFRQLLRRTYSLDRDKAIQYANKGGASRPRLMIVSRKRTRILLNEDQISKMARKLGFEVVSAEGDVSANLTKFAQLVNSCDVMMGVHGAGLTNMVFLPEKAVVIQIVPLGAIDTFARLDFGNPSGAMNLRYLEYQIETKESSLIERYPIDHPVISDPISVHREGWAKLREVYLNNQNVTIDVRRFRATLTKAFKLLRR